MTQTIISPASRLRLPRLGFLGVGWIGRHRLESVLNARAAEIVAVADPVDENLQNLPAGTESVARCGSLEDLLALELDGIVIATPSALHAEQATAALNNGLAVFCQKPLGRTADEVGRIIGSARQANRLLGVDLSYRHCAGLRRIRQLIRDGELGQVFSGELVFHNAYGPDKPWFYDRKRSGGGCLIDLGIHLVDLASWLLEDEIVHVFGRLYAGGKPLAPSANEVEDYATAVLTMRGGASIQLACSWKLHAGADAVIAARTYGTQGGASWENVGGSFTDFRSFRYEGTHRSVLTEPPDPWGGGAICHWARQLQLDRSFDPEIEEHLGVASVLDAIYAGEPAKTAPAFS
jgi:predicted dehydrogenase